MAFNGGFDRQHYAVTGLLFNILEKTQMKHPSIFKASPLLAALLIANNALAQEQAQDNSPVTLETVKVNADFRELDLQQIPSAITVVGQDDIQKRNADHLESILSLAPNVNYSAGASRGRYFQIRGIGERSQFVDAVNPSVGLIIDGVDMTGLGGAATLFDVQQVEILRGPQGTAFGANALAGAINIKSKQPTKETEGYVEAEVGNYGKQTLGTAVSGPLSNSVQGRFAINKTISDGYMENAHLNRDDTNNIEETVARAQLNWQANENNDFSFSLLKADIDNGYDAFSLDNNRTTYSDKPGKDTQDTTSSSIKWVNSSNNSFNIETLASHNESDSVYSFDEDWAYGEYDSITYGCITATCIADYNYNGIDEYIRSYERSNIDIRLLSTLHSRLFNESTHWVAGIYYLQRDESLIRNHTGNYLDGAQFTSELKQTSTALYTELSSQLSDNTTLTYGVRIEDWTNDYLDSGNINEDATDTLWGGKIALENIINTNHLAYGSLAHGYKAGGINSDPDISIENRTFDTETNNSVEVGLKSSLLNDDLTTRIAVFYIQRKDQQVKSSYAEIVGTVTTWKEFLSNAAEGRNYGLEIESNWEISSAINWDLSVGILHTEFVDYFYTNEDDITINKDGDTQAHAPEYSVATAFTFQLHRDISLIVESEAKDDFYFSDSHYEKSKSYVLFHAQLQYLKDNLTLSLNGHNLTDKDYAVRGFGFDNDPREGNDPTQHTQLAAPRLVSINARYNF